MLDEEIASLYAAADRNEPPNAAIERAQAKLNSALSGYGFEVTERKQADPK